MAQVDDRARPLSHGLGIIGLMLILALWFSLLNPRAADRYIDSLAGSEHEYKIVLGAGLVANLLTFLAAIRASKWWYLGVALASGTLAFFVVSLWV